MNKNMKSLMTEIAAVSALSFCAGFGVLLCLITAYDLPCDTLLLGVLCALISLFCAVAFALPKHGGLLLLPVVLGAGGILLFGWSTVVSGAKIVVQTIAENLAVHFYFIPASMTPVSEQYTAVAVASFGTLFLLLVCLTLILYLAWSLARFGNFLLTIWAFVPLFALSMVMSYMYPSQLALTLVLTFLIIMILTSAARSGEFSQFPRLALRLLPWVLGLLLLLTGIFPRSNYKGESGLSNWKDGFDQVFEGWQDGRRQGSILQEQLEQNLSNLGDQRRSDEVVFEVKSTYAGEILLRGYSLATYKGTNWQRVSEEYAADPAASIMLALAAVEYPEYHRLAVRLAGRGGYVLYTPYFIQNLLNQTQATEEFVEANVRASEYTWNFIPRTGKLLAHNQGSDAYFREQRYRTYVNKHYLMTDRALAESFRNLLEEEGLQTSGDRSEVVRGVLEYVRGAAAYTLTPRTASGDGDFVLSFLRETKEGYCVHFATASAALLQALNIPARYVSGFSVTIAEPDLWSPVIVDDAHAWVEVYFDGIGWVPFDPTPGNSLGDIPDANMEPDITPAPTEVPVTQEPNESSDPLGTTDNLEPTPEPNIIVEGKENKQARSHFWWIWLPIALGLSFAVLWLRRKAHVRSRQARFLGNDSNRAYLAMWAYATELSAFEIPLPEEYLTAAQKAAFSQHMVTEEELQVMLDFVLAARRKFSEKKLTLQKLHALWIRCL